MELDELQKVWDSQNNKPMYVIREEALHQKILSKNRKASKTATITEWILIFTGLLAAAILIVFDFFYDEGNAFSFISVILFALITVYGVTNKFLRKNKSENFEQTMLGDLENALSVSDYQVKLSKGMLFWFWPAVYLVSVLSLVMSDKSLWLALALAILFSAVSYASWWEHKCYIRRRDELKTLKKKLLETPTKE